MTSKPEQVRALHAEAVEVLRAAEAEIQQIFERGEVRAAIDITRSDDVSNAVDDAEREIEQARAQSQEIAQNAIDRINDLMTTAGEQAEARRLAAVLQAAVKNPRPGIRFSDHVEEAQEAEARSEDHELDSIAETALNIEGALNRVLLPFFANLERSIDDLDRPVDGHDHHAAHEHALHSDEVDLFGRNVTVPGGLYTVVFVVLAIVTIVEVLIAESPLPNAIGYPLLAALSIGKAVLVVMYYMHLREDSRIFIWSFGLPLAMAALIIVFLLVMNPFAYP